MFKLSGDTTTAFVEEGGGSEVIAGKFDAWFVTADGGVGEDRTAGLVRFLL